MGQLLSSAAAAGDVQALAYWSYHLARTAFFLGLSATGAVTHHAAHQLQGALSALGLAPGGGGAGERRPTPFENLSANARAEVLSRLREALAVYRQDLAAVQGGHFQLPWDMTTPGHKQYNPLFVARMCVCGSRAAHARTGCTPPPAAAADAPPRLPRVADTPRAAAFAGEAVATLDRRMANVPVDNWFTSPLFPGARPLADCCWMHRAWPRPGRLHERPIR